MYKYAQKELEILLTLHETFDYAVFSRLIISRLFGFLRFFLKYQSGTFFSF